MTRRSSCCCSCFSCFSGRNNPSLSALSDASAAAVDPNAPSPTEMVATGHHLQTPPSSSTSGAQGKSIEPSFSSSSAHQDASCAVVVKQDEVVPSSPSGGASSIPLAPPCAASSSSTVPETATSSASAISSASSRVPTVAMATDDIHQSQQSVASSSTQPGEAHSSSFQGTTSSSSITNTNKDAAGLEGDNVDVDLDALIERISERLRLIKEREKPPQTKGAQQYWPTTSKTFFKLKELISEGITVVKDVIPGDAIKTAVKGLLQGMGTADLVTAGLLVVANILERFEEVEANKDESLRLLKEMIFLAKLVKQIKEPQEIHNIIKEATELIIEGCTMCCYQIEPSKYSKFFKAPVNKGDLDNFRPKIDRMYRQINTQMGIYLLDAIDRKKTPLSRRYPDHAVGIEESVKEIIDLLELESDKNAIAIMVHGFGGIGKTTLADAVFSSAEIQGCKYSKVQLFENIDSTPKIVELQRLILEDLMDEPVPVFRSRQDGQREVGSMLEKVPAFIYIDNVLGQEELRQLLPKDMKKAKKVRLLLTARDTDVRRALKVETIPYAMKGLHNTEAMQLLGREIYAGTDDKDNQLHSTQLNQIVQSYGGIPALLEVVGGFIRAEEDKQEAYRILMKEKGKWDTEIGKIDSYLFAYDCLPEIYRDPFLDICSFFKGWDWDRVADIVGEIELKLLESRSLVSRGTNGVVVVHNVILSIGLQKTQGVRFTFTSRKQVEELLNEKDTEGIRGIWLTERNDVPKEEDDDNDDRKVVVQASALDKFHKSFRVLQLGNSIKVEGNCNEIFKELVFFEAKISQLPFDDVSQLPQLRYLSYDPPNWVPSSLPSSLAIMNFNGKTFQRIND